MTIIQEIIYLMINVRINKTSDTFGYIEIEIIKIISNAAKNCVVRNGIIKFLNVKYILKMGYKYKI